MPVFFSPEMSEGRCHLSATVGQGLFPEAAKECCLLQGKPSVQNGTSEVIRMTGIKKAGHIQLW